MTDPAAGSGGIENLTAELAKTAWSLFQQIEKAGGVFAALKQNLLQEKVAAVRDARDKNIARRKEVLTGASEFPNLHEAPVAVLSATPVQLAPYGESKIYFDPLVPNRLSAPFERLRDLSDRIHAKQGKRPEIFLANLGTAADFTARATFTKSFFEAGGIEAVGSDGYTEPLVLAEAFKTSGAPLVCICSSDRVYAELGVSAAQVLQAAGAKHIYLAGHPGDQETKLRDGGVKEFVYAGGNALATLTAAYANMGVS